MKEGWEIKTLGEVCKIVGGGTPSKNRLEFYGGTINWASVRDLNSEILLTTEHTITKLGLQNSSTNLIPKNNVIFASRVGLGKVCIAKIDVAINQDLRAPIPKNLNQLDVDYLFRWFQNQRDVIINAGQGATVQGITLPFINNLPIPIPPLPEQQRIVSIIDKAFEAIDKAIENTQKNLQNAKELFESYLNKVFENDGDWEKKSLNELYQIGSSRRVLKSQWKTEGIPFYRGREITRIAADGFVDNELYISEEHYAELIQKTGVPKTGDIVMTAIGTIGNTHIVRDIDRFYFKDASVLWLKRISQTNSEFIRYYLKSSLFFNQLDKGNGATVDTLTIDKLQNIQLFLPQFDEQKTIVQNLDALQSETKNLEHKYQQKLIDLGELKKSILNKAFAGEL
jgi:type I restriction enzyme S subunit